MEQAQSTIKTTFDPLLPGTRAAHGVSNDTYPGGHQALTLLVNDRMAGSRRTQVRPANVPQGDNLFSFNEGTADTPTQMGGAEPGIAPIDYACATNEQLLEGARSADKDAFAELCSRHVQSVHRKVFRIARNHEDAEDVVQETLLKAYTHLSGFRGSCTFSTWLTSIAINCALMLLRKRKGHFESSFDHSMDDDQTWSSREFADPHLDTERSYARRQAINVLSRAVVRLPLRYRSVLERHHAREQSMKETADALGLSVAAVKSRLLRARLNLRASLAKKGISIADAYF